MNTGIWILVIYAGITGWGPGLSQQIEFPDKASCHAALESAVVRGANQTSGEDDEQLIMLCRPK